MRSLPTSATLRVVQALLLITASYFLVTQTRFSYLFIGNVLLLVGMSFLCEGVFLFALSLKEKWRTHKKTGVARIRALFILIFITDSIIRLMGTMNIYSEVADGNYFSLAKQEQLDSWYWTHTPNTRITNQKKEFLFEREVNSLGLSEKELKKEKGDKFRILTIGDSFTEGVGLSYEESWVKQMETRWKEYNVETMNAGIGGSDPVFELVLYRDKLVEFQPNLVVVTINASDISDVSSRGGFERFHPDGTAGKEPPEWEWIYASNHLFRMILHRLFKYDASLVKGSSSQASQRKAVAHIKEAIDQFGELTKANNTSLLVVIHPSIQELRNGKHTPFLGQEELVKHMKLKGIEYLDVSKTFEAKGMSVGKYYYPLDSHFNKKGYALFGNAVYTKIEEMEVLK